MHPPQRLLTLYSAKPMSNATEDKIRARLGHPAMYVAVGVYYAVSMYAVFMSASFLGYLDLTPDTWIRTLILWAAAGFLLSLVMYGMMRWRKRKGTFAEHIKKQAARIARSRFSLRHRYWYGIVMAVVSFGVAVLLTYHSAAGTTLPHVLAVARVFLYGFFGIGVLGIGYGVYRAVTGKADAAVFKNFYLLRNRHVRGAAALMGLLAVAAILYVELIAMHYAVATAGAVLLACAVVLGGAIGIEAALRYVWRRRRQSPGGAEPLEGAR